MRNVICKGAFTSIKLKYAGNALKLDMFVNSETLYSPDSGIPHITLTVCYNGLLWKGR